MDTEAECWEGHMRKNSSHWKRMMMLRKEPVYQHDEKRYWTRSITYLYCIMLGNGADGIPAAFRFCLNVSGGVYILVTMIFMFTLVMPIMYTEAFLGKFTGLANSQLYRMSPIFFGFSVMIFIVNTIYCPLRIMDISIFLIAALKLIINPDYITYCPEDVDGCQEFGNDVELNKPCEYTYIGFKCGNSSDTIRYISGYLYWAEFRDLESSFDYLQYSVATIITGFIIMLFTMVGVRILGIFFKASLFINILMNLITLLLAITTDGSGGGLSNIIDFRLTGLDFTEILKVGIFTTIKIGLMTPSGYMSYAAFTLGNSKMGPGAECLFLCFSNLLMAVFQLLVIHAVGGVLAYQLGLNITEVIVPGSGIYYSMIPQFLKNKECPYIFIILFHTSNWLLEVIRLALCTHMQILNLYDFFPTLTRHHVYVLLLAAFTSTGLGILFSVEIFCKVLCPLYYVLEVNLLQSIKLVLMSVMVFYCYGVRRLSDDIHYVTGRRPIKYWRLIWYVYPCLIVAMECLIILSRAESTDGSYIDMVDHKLVSTMLEVSGMVAGSFMCIFFTSTFLYVLIGIRSSTAMLNMLKPQFFWGPSDKESRIGRKAFAPRSSIRSQPPKKMKRRFRPLSIKQLHERDLAEHVKRGRIFLDPMFFTTKAAMETVPTNAYRLFVKKRSEEPSTQNVPTREQQITNTF